MNQAISISSTRENPTAIIICAFRTLAIADQILRDFVFAVFILVNKHPKHEQQPSNRNFLPLRRHHNRTGDDLSRNLIPSLSSTPAAMLHRQSLLRSAHIHARVLASGPMTCAYAAGAGTPSIETFPYPFPSHTPPEITPYGIPMRTTSLGDVDVNNGFSRPWTLEIPTNATRRQTHTSGQKPGRNKPGPDLVFVSDSGPVR